MPNLVKICSIFLKLQAVKKWPSFFLLRVYIVENWGYSKNEKLRATRGLAVANEPRGAL